MKLTNKTIVSLASLFLIACGGGGGSAAPSPTPAPTPVPTPTPTPTPVPVPVPDPDASYDNTAQLIADRSFNLTQEYQLTINYNTNEQRRVYLSLCGDFTQTAETIDINYNSCLLRTATDSNYSSALNVANDKQSLVMAIWYLDDINNPKFVVWENDGSVIGNKTFTIN